MHRDIKPDNILLEKNKDFSRVKVIDFGYVVLSVGLRLQSFRTRLSQV